MRIDLKYGKGTVQVDLPADLEVLNTPEYGRALNDVELGDALDSPIDSPQLEDLVTEGGSVLLVVPDATRSAAAGQVANLVVRRLIAAGVAPGNISAIFANGIHRKTTDEEKSLILTPFLAQRLKMFDHDARDLAAIVNLGTTSGGIPVEINRAVFDNDHVITIGSVGFHYFAGFGGGRKMICPGLASSRTIAATHKLAFDCDTRDRRSGVGTGHLAGNAVHKAMIECVEKAPPTFAINTLVNDSGESVRLICGNWKTSHSAACDEFAQRQSISISEKRPLVIASCGGDPHDINLIQAHKTLEAASGACAEGGTIVLVAECRDGLGRNDFLQWFDVSNGDALAERLCEKYRVNGQTAWSLLKKAERFQVKAVTALDRETLAKMRIEKIDMADIPALLNYNAGYVIPAGAKISIVSE